MAECALVSASERCTLAVGSAFGPRGLPLEKEKASKVGVRLRTGVIYELLGFISGLARGPVQRGHEFLSQE